MTARRERAAAVRLLEFLRREPTRRLVERDGGYLLAGDGMAERRRVDARLVRALRAGGLLREAEPGRLASADPADAWLKRQAGGEHAFKLQHHPLEPTRLDDGRTALLNPEESPVASLSRRIAGREAWLAPHAVTAAERLRRDFEIGGLQPRVTANWSASVATGRRSGDGAGLADLTDMALAARLRVDRAIEAVGPELAGVLVDICCFLKGLGSVERERQWPARSAKLALRLGLDALARHYGLKPAAEGRAGSAGIRHWGDEGYRPEVS
jgi:hypothetical protein